MDALDRYLDAGRDRFVSELRELCHIPSETGEADALDTAATSESTSPAQVIEATPR